MPNSVFIEEVSDESMKYLRHRRTVLEFLHETTETQLWLRVPKDTWESNKKDSWGEVNAVWQGGKSN